MIKAVELRKGKTILHNGELFIVHDAQHVAKGNKRSYMQVTMRNLKTGQLNDVRFRAADSVEEAYIDKKPVEYLYSQGSEHILMLLDTYDQISIGDDIMADSLKYLKPNTQLEVTIYDGNVVSIELPTTVDLQITSTPPAIKGSTATNQNKEAILETGLKVKVPPFVEEGQIIRVDTRTGEYLERVR